MRNLPCTPATELGRLGALNAGGRLELLRVVTQLLREGNSYGWTTRKPTCHGVHCCSAGRSLVRRTPTKPQAPMQRELYLASSPAAGAVQVHEHKRFLTVLPDDDSLAIANNSGNNIQIISANGALRRNLGSRGDAPGQFLGPAGLACDGQAIYVTDWCHRVQKLKLDGTSVATACEYGSGEGQLCFPTGAALAGGILFVADTLNNRVVRFEAESLKWLSTFGGEGRAEGQFLGPCGLASTEDEVFVVDGHGQRIQALAPCVRVFTNTQPWSAAFGLLPVARRLIDAPCYHYEQVFNLHGGFVRTFGSWGTEPGQFDGPRGIAVANGARAPHSSGPPPFLLGLRIDVRFYQCRYLHVDRPLVRRGARDCLPSADKSWPAQKRRSALAARQGSCLPMRHARTHARIERLERSSGRFLAGWGCPRPVCSRNTGSGRRRPGAGAFTRRQAVAGAAQATSPRPPYPLLHAGQCPASPLRPFPALQRSPACHTRCSSPPQAVLSTACVSSRDRRSEPLSAACVVPRDAR